MEKAYYYFFTIFYTLVFISIDSIAQTTIFSKRYEITIEDLDTNLQIEKEFYKEIVTLDLKTKLDILYQIESTLDTSSIYIPYLYLKISGVSIDLNMLDNAKVYADKALRIAKEREFKNYMHVAYRKLGSIAFLNKNNAQAIEYFDFCLQTTTKPDKYYLIKYNIASIYTSLGKNDIADNIYQEIVEYIEHNPTMQISKLAVLINIALGKMSNKYSLEQCLSYLEKAETIAKALNNEDLIIKSLYIQYLFELETEGYSIKSIKQVERILNKAKLYNRKILVDRLHLHLAISYTTLNKFNDATYYIDKLIQEEYPAWMNTSIDTLSIKCNLYLGNIDMAYSGIQNHLKYLNTINEKRDSEIYLKWAKKYETEKKNQELKILYQENKIKGLSLKKQKQISILLITLVIIIIGFSVYIITLKNNERRRIGLKNKIIVQQNNELKHANLNKERFFKIISHDLRGPYNALLGYTSLLYKEFETFNKADIKNFIHIIHESTIYNFDLINDLLFWSKTQGGKMTTSVSQVNIKKLLHQITSPYQIIYNKKNISYNSYCSSKNIFIDKDIMSIVIANLFSNAVKFAPINGTVTINQYIIDKTLFFEVIDNGLGFTETDLYLINSNPDIEVDSKTRNIYKENLGIVLCKDLLYFVEGELFVENNKDIGAKVTVKIPYNLTQN